MYTIGQRRINLSTNSGNPVTFGIQKRRWKFAKHHDLPIKFVPYWDNGVNNLLKLMTMITYIFLFNVHLCIVQLVLISSPILVMKHNETLYTHVRLHTYTNAYPVGVYCMRVVNLFFPRRIRETAEQELSRVPVFP